MNCCCCLSHLGLCVYPLWCHIQSEYLVLRLFELNQTQDIDCKCLKYYHYLYSYMKCVDICVSLEVKSKPPVNNNSTRNINSNNNNTIILIIIMIIVVVVDIISI